MKEHLCACLDDHKEKLNNMRTQIEQNSKRTCKLRKIRRQARNKLLAVKPSMTCAICYNPVFQKRGNELAEPLEVTGLLVYPCSHVFHRQCIRFYLYEYQSRNPAI